MAKKTLLERDDNPEASIPGSGRRRKFAAEAALHPKLAKLPSLQLNADMRPIWHHPLSTINWADVIWLIAKGELTGIPRINVIDVYPDVFVNTGTRRYPLPSVVSHRQIIPWPKKVPLTRFNLLLRDNFTCQYTGVKLPNSMLNIDHVIPKSQGGTSSWDNVVASDKRINTLKDNKTPKQAGLRLLRAPREPSVHKLYDMGRAYPPSFMHRSWSPFLTWKVPVEYSWLDGEIRELSEERVREDD